MRVMPPWAGPVSFRATRVYTTAPFLAFFALRTRVVRTPPRVALCHGGPYRFVRRGRGSVCADALFARRSRGMSVALCCRPHPSANVCLSSARRVVDETSVHGRQGGAVTVDWTGARARRVRGDKDVFQTFYTTKVSKRLIHGVSASDESEAIMITKLKEACGFEYTNKLQRMFTDMSLSKDLSDSFKQRMSQMHDDAGDITFSIMGLSTNFWPLTPPTHDFLVPRELLVTYALLPREALRHTAVLQYNAVDTMGLNEGIKRGHLARRAARQGEGARRGGGAACPESGCVFSIVTFWASLRRVPAHTHPVRAASAACPRLPAPLCVTGPRVVSCDAVVAPYASTPSLRAAHGACPRYSMLCAASTRKHVPVLRVADETNVCAVGRGGVAGSCVGPSAHALSDGRAREPLRVLGSGKHPGGRAVPAADVDVPDVVDVDDGLCAADVDVGDALDVDVRAGGGTCRESWRKYIEGRTGMCPTLSTCAWVPLSMWTYAGRRGVGG
ncbi:Cullin family-domain-containing protein [Mycena rebaudengoi]|nr:Cullin family-domain-containing protein [Mycena rebaudengoi]